AGTFRRRHPRVRELAVGVRRQGRGSRGSDARRARGPGARPMSPASGSSPTALITGGAGFVGCNVAADLLADGWRVRVLDDLSRAGVRDNLDWLLASYPDRVEPVVADLLDARRLGPALAGVDAVYHFAA